MDKRNICPVPDDVCIHYSPDPSNHWATSCHGCKVAKARYTGYKKRQNMIINEPERGIIPNETCK